MRKQNGITLITLVITIIILLILAFVGISLGLGNDGIINKTVKARNDYQGTSLKEELAMAWTDYSAQQYINNKANFEESVRKVVDPDQIKNITIAGDTAIIEGKEDTYKVDIISGTIVADTEFDVWDGVSASIGLIGKGSATEPYLIRSANDLNYFRKVVESEPQARITGLNEDGVTPNNVNLIACQADYKLTRNIALNDVSNFNMWIVNENSRNNLNEWTPIGYPNVRYFYGTFDGDGHEITGMYENLPEYTHLGLFSKAVDGSKITNLRLTKVYVVGQSYVGGVVGELCKGEITNCYLSGYVEARPNSNGDWGGEAGGFAGWLTSGNMDNCHADAIVKAKFEAGGFVGQSSRQSATDENLLISNSTFKGEVHGNNAVGGFVGRSAYTNFVNCTNEANIYHAGGTAKNSFAGIAGVLTSANVESCRNYGNITVPEGTEYVAGIVGAAYQYNGNYVIADCVNKGNVGTNANYIGGIVGDLCDMTATTTVDSCSNTGTITSNKTHKGDLLGRHYSN